ncbi:RNase P modulator RnpM [Sporosalibacterium faouarense]|uniref:RNase P modulator RnpM n=1 Tax=Sporosalibacterium faouarense TaxID=516123 RepID=UPI00141C1085|nr:YlxR family protein [Sporosalibacterium faouarense]MTI48036.1 YlxR family protein [Bacillota bacterium]
MRKKIPIRKCVGCGESKPKKDLIRIVKSKDGDINVDLSGKLNGRGVYICNNVDCFEKAKKSKGLNRSLKMEVPEEVYKNLLLELNQNE